MSLSMAVRAKDPTKRIIQLSGTVAIIGKSTGEILYLGIKNITKFAQQQRPVRQLKTTSALRITMSH